MNFIDQYSHLITGAGGAAVMLLIMQLVRFFYRSAKDKKISEQDIIQRFSDRVNHLEGELKVLNELCYKLIGENAEYRVENKYLKEQLARL